MALLFRKASAVARETPILSISRPRFIRRSSVGLLSRNVSVSVPVQLAAESAAPPTAAIPRLTVNFPKNAGQARVWAYNPEKTLLPHCHKIYNDQKEGKFTSIDAEDTYKIFRLYGHVLQAAVRSALFAPGETNVFCGASNGQFASKVK